MFFKKAAVLGLAVAGAYGAQIQKRDGAHGHAHAAAAPASGYGAPAPATGYGAPDTGYAAPDTGYGAPDTGYGAPDTGYAAPSDGYEAAPAYGADDAAVGPGILPFVAVILAIIGLSLLFPAVVNVQTRKRRSLAEEANPVYDLAERVQDMYSAVLRSESCMEKIVCELGGMAKDLTASPVTGLVEPFVPTKYSNMYKTFKNGKDCHKIKC
jgi:uncharacterized membrane protein